MRFLDLFKFGILETRLVFDRSPVVKMSDKGISFLKSIEKFRANAYDDQTGEDIEVWVPGATIGFGHLISKEEWFDFCGREISAWEANHLFQEDLSPFEFCVMCSVDDAFQLPDHQFDALVLLAFNIGQSAFNDSSVVKLINNPYAITNYSDIEAAWMAWNKSQGKVMQGLVNRRGAEWQIYASGIYERW